MTTQQRRLRRQQLDAMLDAPRSVTVIRPRGGWIKALREAMGMSLDILGARLGTTRQSAHQLERAEAYETITLKRLRAAAEALECDLVFYLQPRKPLEAMIRDRARTVAREIVLRAGNSMAMEDQALSDGFAKTLIEETADDLIKKGDNRIWT